jgi:Flp pilus assembly protein TadD/4-amino-4-deoxy-L-arabinose transferase-like glycosyltransferase
MDSDRRLPVGFWLALGVGFALRLWYVSDLAQQPWFGYPLVDSLTFDRAAREILAQGHPGTFFRPPFYPYFLAALYAGFGRSFGAVAAVQSLLGLAALYPAYRLGERWFGRTAAIAGAWIGACYPLRIFFEGEVLDVTLFSFLLLWGLWALWRGLERASGLALLLSGLLLGAAALTRPNVLFTLPFVALGAALAFRREGSMRAATAAAWALGVALAMAPTAVHNWRTEGAFVPVAANGGVNFYLGNERSADGRTPVPPGLRWEAVMLRPIREGHGSLSAQDRWWYARAGEEIAAAPGRWLRLLGVKTALFFNAAEASNNKALAHFTAVSFPVRHYRWWYGVLVCLGAVGCVARPGRGSLFLALFTAGFAGSVVLFFVAERYRLPLVPLFASAAAAGVLELRGALRGGAWGRLAMLLGTGAVTALVVLPDWFGAGRERISADFQMGQIYLMRGEPESALTHLERAGVADPRDPDVLNSLGAAHVQRGDLAGAEAAYQAALSLGEFGEVWYNLGVLAERRGPQYRSLAAERYRRALAVNPTSAAARANLEALERDGAAGAPAVTGTADPGPQRR